MADGAVARVAHRPVVLRRRLPGDDLRRPPARHQRRRPRRPRPRPQVGEGGGGALRRRRGVRHDPQLRDGPAVARADVARSATCSACRSLSKASPSSSRRSSWASTSTAGAVCRRALHLCTLDPDDRRRRVRHVLRARRERLDERPVRVPARRRRDTVTDVDPLAAMFNGAVWQQFIHMFVAGYARHRVRHRRGLRRRHAARPARPAPPPRLHRSVHVRRRGGGAPAVHRPLRRHAPVRRPAVASWRRWSWRRPRGRGPRCSSAASSSTARCAARIPIPRLGSLMSRSGIRPAVPGPRRVPAARTGRRRRSSTSSFQTMVGAGTLMVASPLWFAWRGGGRGAADPTCSRRRVPACRRRSPAGWRSSPSRRAGSRPRSVASRGSCSA